MTDTKCNQQELDFLQQKIRILKQILVEINSYPRTPIADILLDSFLKLEIEDYILLKITYYYDSYKKLSNYAPLTLE